MERRWDGYGTETMATTDAHQPYRPFHRRVCSPATGHAHHAPGAPPDVPPAIAGAVFRSNGPPLPPRNHGPRRGPHADPHIAPYRHPDDPDGSPAPLRSRLIGSSAVSDAYGRPTRRLGGASREYRPTRNVLLHAEDHRSGISSNRTTRPSPMSGSLTSTKGTSAPSFS